MKESKLRQDIFSADKMIQFGMVMVIAGCLAATAFVQRQLEVSGDDN